MPINTVGLDENTSTDEEMDLHHSEFDEEEPLKEKVDEDEQPHDHNDACEEEEENEEEEEEETEEETEEEIRHKIVSQAMENASVPNEIPQIIKDAVLMPSDDSIIDKSNVVRGYDFNSGIDCDKLISGMFNVGFQATNMGKAVKEINRMLNWRLSDEPIAEDDDITDPEERAKVKCKIFLGFTSNQVSSGNREVIRFLAQHKMVDVMVTTCGAIEEDIMKCLNDTYVGRFDVAGHKLRKSGVNRIGNLFVPNKNYVDFESWLQEVLNQCLKEQKEEGTIWTPSRLIARMGREINDERSVLYWAYKNNIPIYSPAITDGAVGDVIYFNSFRNPGFVLDIVKDICEINQHAVYEKKTGMIILGGGLIKHHICNANLMRNGADFSVFINTGQEFDGSDSGARPEEAKSWGKIKLECNAVKVYGDATVFFPLIVSQTFAKYYWKNIAPQTGATPQVKPVTNEELNASN
mmetsp:Transcript_10959/g.16089  ORF Transcript_10959/g.16089 Transcript_10959/m.16089 type:complete len:465 (-) Transcript_10959:2606-4000(-)|eukprot:CAMPEP_0117428168 /NCGR_PEP_ID=MMETSP0758-20121206/7944_1 /TAXON_ID=63605 /ORGANISM="Percolomonas cosmopolitus, Strain AE-1 (ATCC 50343)" /LENGTH=464 /DNA_ID=CAMNT_0005214391 /DNA_START=530 /DNA_END=1924 /DNA_ORIENTATION=+